MKYKRIIILIPLVIIVVGLIWWLNYQRSFQTAVFSLKKPVIVDIYEGSSIAETEHGHGEEISAIATITQRQKIKLRKGSYYAISRATDEYEQQEISFDLGGREITINVTPDYTDKKLQTFLPQERKDIITSLTSAFPKINELYEIEKGRLYKQGEWYATTLTYKGPTGQYPSDTLRVILRKKDGKWEIMTKPPQIVLSIVQQPEIPDDVVRDVNRQ